MDQVVRTIYGSYLQTVQLMGLDYAMAANTTLNEKFSVQAGVVPSTTEMPKARYLAVGIGGHAFVTGAGGVPYVSYLQHRATDAALFKQLPFVLRTTDNDLTAGQRANYAMRRTETHNGIPYYAYYLKRIDVSALIANMEYNTVVNGETTTTKFTPTSANLNPTPPDLTALGVNATLGDYVSTSAKFALALIASDVTELLNAAKVIYGEEAYAFISEIAIVTGVDKIVQGTIPTGTFNYNEAIAAQVHSFINMSADMQALSDGFIASIDVGATEPLGYGSAV